MKLSLFYKLAIWLPYFVIGAFFLLTVLMNIRLVAKMAAALSGSQLTSLPKNQSLFLGITFWVDFLDFFGITFVFYG
ncbi:MAG: hypothetical protein HY026_02155 [Deltaproteobacteria bacterium]|nr:hypothetical protein [Deltaproteobacteria bacterium]